MSVVLSAERYLAQPGVGPAERNVEIEVSEDGPVSIRPGQGRSGVLAMPAPVNAHDHGYGIRTLDFGLLDDALETWIPGLRVRPATDPYLEALVSFGRLLQSGCSATMHCHNSLNVDSLVEEAGAVARAARDSGIRLGLSCPLLDASPWIYGDVEALRSLAGEAQWAQLSVLLPRYAPVSAQIEAVEQVATEHAGHGVDVQYGPIGPQWASDALLEAVAEASCASGRRIHMHLLESPRQRQWLDRRFPGGIVRHLAEIGFLSPRLAVAHGVQLRPEECELLAEYGVTVVTNPSANLRLRSGIAPLETLKCAGTKFAIGLDGTGFDDDQDIWRELRLAWLLHGGRTLEPALSEAELFEAVTERGAAVVNQSIEGDIVTIDYGALTRDALFDDLDEVRVLLARMSAAHVIDLIIAGRLVVRDGTVRTFDFDAARTELAAQARAQLPRLETERGIARQLADLIRRYYRDWDPQASI
ncbi:amidohydrolase family protein [Roseibium sp.]|uniref:amidohydrolase family protein n=1 Tax=Roseibium sp. TaxID=1936156 RepID=UPI003A96D6D1